MTHQELRTEVVQHMRTNRVDYENFVDGQTFEQYCSSMTHSRRGWGDNLTLVAIARILKRPIRLVTNRRGGEYEIVIEPPPDVARRGGEIVLAFYGEKHYEGTAPQ